MNVKDSHRYGFMLEVNSHLGEIALKYVPRLEQDVHCHLLIVKFCHVQIYHAHVGLCTKSSNS